MRLLFQSLLEGVGEGRIHFINENFNLCLNKGEFPKIFKIAEVTPIYKKPNLFEKDNYRPTSILYDI